MMRLWRTSPHTWGKTDRLWLFRIFGNIPTYVRKTDEVFIDHSVSQEHPHMRVEDQHIACPSSNRSGTSPHAWGRQALKQLGGKLCRNIPTCVWNTFVVMALACILKEHPHMRGEDTKNVKQIKDLTFSKAPNLLTFNDFQKSTERSNCLQATIPPLKSSNSLFTCQRTLFQT